MTKNKTYETALKTFVISYIIGKNEEQAKIICNALIKAVDFGREYERKRAEKLVEALKFTATPEGIIHSVFPKCLCNSCKQQKAIKSYRRIS